MVKERIKKSKQQVIERLWLIYFNETLFAKGLISEVERHKIKLRILTR